MKKLRLKRKYLIMITVLMTLLSIKGLNLFAEVVTSRVNEIKKVAQACDLDNHKTCSYYELRNYSNNK